MIQKNLLSQDHLSGNKTSVKCLLSERWAKFTSENFQRTSTDKVSEQKHASNIQASLCLACSQNFEKRLLASACTSVRMEKLGSNWTDFLEIPHLSIF